jgi:guanylate kinase
MNPSAPLPCSPAHRRGVLFVLSAPSGAGKSTLRRGLEGDPGFVYSVSCTTRAPRPGEVDGSDYHFLSRAAFEERIAAGEFLEYAEVHGNYYGTLCSTVLESLRHGVDVLLDIDVQGAAAIRAHAHPEIRESLADIFLMPASLDLLRQRLAKRGTESAEQVELRLSNAAQEMQAWRDYRYTILTGTVEEDLAHFRAIMDAERAVSRRLKLDW